MLTYLISITEDFLAVALILGVTLAIADSFNGDRGRGLCRGTMALGLVAAVIRTYITNTRRLVGGWKVGTWGYGISLVMFVLLVAALIVCGRKLLKQENVKDSLWGSILSVVMGLTSAVMLYNALPNVLIAPFKFTTGDNGYLSTEFLFRLGGYLLALIVCLISAICAYRLISLAVRKGLKVQAISIYAFVSTLYGVYAFACLMSVLTPRKIINSVTLFKFAAFSNNHSSWYTYAEFAILLILAIVMWIRSKTVKEPYNTKAEHRKQRAVWRSMKRHAVVLLGCFIIGILCATWFVELNTVKIKEAPVEDPVIVKDASGNDYQVCVPLTMVEDGHLHRFGYTTADGKNVRFIVILKQANTTNYGVGLDACEICGEAGYYENNEGQVVCKKCNVVMNTTTIGMKGGCNPIIIDYDIDESQITVPVEELVNNKDRFTK